MRTATLDLSSRGSFVDDLNSKPGIVMRRDALLHRSREIQPAFSDSARAYAFIRVRRAALLFFYFRNEVGPPPRARRMGVVFALAGILYVIFLWRIFFLDLRYLFFFFTNQKIGVL